MQLSEVIFNDFKTIIDNIDVTQIDKLMKYQDVINLRIKELNEEINSNGTSEEQATEESGEEAGEEHSSEEASTESTDQD